MLLLTAYPFSSNELSAMLLLRQLFNEGGFSIDRYPKINEDSDPQPIYQILKSREEQEKDSSLMDILGIYTDFSAPNPKILHHHISENIFTQEGRIILFSKRLEEFASEKELSLDAVRFVVLVHELGHWFSHWASSYVHDCKHNELPGWGTQWVFGFNFSNRRTEEALANLCVYWVLNHPEITKHIDRAFIDSAKNAFDKLTPKGNNQEVNTDDPYGAYALLTAKDSVDVIRKINELRGNWMFSDNAMMQFLCSDTLKMKEFYPQPLLDHVHPKMQTLVENNPNSEVLLGSFLKLVEDSCLCALGIIPFFFLEEGPDISNIDI
jgi:hypothetical protein